MLNFSHYSFRYLYLNNYFKNIFLLFISYYGTFYENKMFSDAISEISIF